MTTQTKRSKHWMLWFIPVVLSTLTFIGYPYVFKPVHVLETSFADISLEDDIALSDMIVYGTIIKQRVVNNPDGSKWDMIEYTIKPIETIYNLQGYQANDIKFLSYEGIFPKEIRKHERSHVFRTGETALFFLVFQTDGYYTYGDALRVSENGNIFPFPDAELAPTLAEQSANGYTTLQRVRDIASEVPYGTYQERLQWAAEAYQRNNR